MPATVMRHSLNACFCACRFEALLTTNVYQDVTAPFWCRQYPALAVSDPLQQIRHCWRYRDVSTVSRLSGLDPDAVISFVNILPLDPDRLSQPAATECHELDQIAVALCATGSTGSDSLDYLLELFR